MTGKKKSQTISGSDIEKINEIKNEQGRTPLFVSNPDQADKFRGAIVLGLSYKSACEYAGWAESTWYEWVQKAEGRYTGPDNYKPEVYREFVDDIKRAMQVGKVSLLNDIKKDDSWQSKAWILERRYPEEFGRIDRMEVTGKDGEEIKSRNITFTKELTVDEAKKLDSDSLLALLKE